MTGERSRNKREAQDLTAPPSDLRKRGAGGQAGHLTARECQAIMP